MNWITDPTGAPTALGIPRRALRVRAVVDGVRLSDEVAHVNNIEYVRWVDQLAAVDAARLGHGRPTMLAAGRMWFVARHELDYRGECFDGDALHAATWIDRIEGARAHRCTAIWKSDARPVLTARSTWALVDLATRRPVRLSTPDLLACTDEPAAAD